MTKLIPLHNHKGDVIANAIVDDADFAWLSQWNWCHFNRGRSGGYATRGEYTRNADGTRSRKTIYMHRVIVQTMDMPANVEIDHRDTNGLNNTRDNLRIALPSQNRANTPKRRGYSSSQFKGVCWNKRANKWVATADQKHIGYYSTELEAAIAYNAAAILHFGEFARLNEVTP